jgi:hypothetical protein
MARPASKQFVVGNTADGADFSTHEIDALIYRIALWFGSAECDRNYDDPVASAREKIQECLLAENSSGDPWKNCPAEFAARVKVKCAYDMLTGKGIPAPRVKHPDAVRALDKKAQAAAKGLDDSNPILADFDQSAFRTDLEQRILAEFPELDNPAHLPNVRSLTMYHAQREIIDRELQAGIGNANKRLTLLESLQRIEVMADVAMKRLGIHFDQVRKKIDSKGASSIGDLVALIGDDRDYATLEDVWRKQLALQCWWMSEHHNGRRTGPQLHDWEIWHMTRNRPVRFKCRHGEEYVIVEGFTPKELYEYLKARKVVIAEPVLPHLIKPEWLEHMEEHLENMPATPTHEGAHDD